MSYSYLGGFSRNPSNAIFTQSLSISVGFVVIACSVQDAPSASTVTLSNGTTLTAGPYFSGNELGVFYGANATSASSFTITAPSSASDNGDFLAGVWSWSGSATVGASASFAGGSGNLNSASSIGDYLIAAASVGSGSETFNTSSQTPSNAGPGTPYVLTGLNGSILLLADWTLSSSYSSGSPFSVATANFNGTVAQEFTPSAPISLNPGSGGTNIMRVRQPGWQW